MKIGFFLLVLSLTSVHATTFSQQKVSLDVKNETLLHVLDILQEQSGFTFLFSSEDVKEIKGISLQANDADLFDVLKKCLNGTGISFQVTERLVVLRKGLEESAVAPQQKSIRVVGKVTDEGKQPLPGVTIAVKGLSVGTVSDKDGKFSLNLPKMEKLSLIFSFIGMESQTIVYTGQDSINVMMKEDVAALDEVTVVSDGYRTIDPRKTTSAITSIRAEDIVVPGIGSIDKMLEGRVPGLTYMANSGQVGAVPRLRIRGTSTVLGNQEPLWVIDGIVQHDPVNVDPQRLNDLDFVNLLGNAISGLNPEDIEQIDVLKDASATAIYGAKASNGVIVITTKKGKQGPPSVGYSFAGTYMRRPHYGDRSVDMMNSTERIALSREFIERRMTFPGIDSWVGYEAAIRDYYNNELSYNDFKQLVNKYETLNTDWFKILTKNAFQHTHTVNLSGGSSQLRYYVSVGLQNTPGNNLGELNRNYTTTTNISANYNKFTVQFSMTGSVEKRKYKPSDVGAMTYAYQTSRAVPAYDDEGNYWYYRRGISGASHRGVRFNILEDIANTFFDVNTNRFSLNTSITYRLLEDLNLNGTFSYSFSNNYQDTYYGDNSYRGRSLKFPDGERSVGGIWTKEDIEKEIRASSYLPYGGELQEEDQQNNSYVVRLQATYNRFLDKEQDHHLNVMAGWELSSSRYLGNKRVIRGYLPDRGKKIAQVDLDEYPMLKRWYRDDASAIGEYTDNLTNMVSAYASLSYTLKQDYTFNINARTDSSNRFGSKSNEKILPIWSVSGRWDIRSSLLRSMNFVNAFTLRASFGYQGNMLETESPEMILTRGSYDAKRDEFISTLGTFANPFLKWEKTQSFNVSLDFSLFKGHLSGTFSYFYRKTENAFLTKRVQRVEGVSSYTVNAGTVKNEGIELGLKVRVIDNNFGSLSKGEANGFRWDFDPGLGNIVNTLIDKALKGDRRKNTLHDEYTYEDYLNGRVSISGKPLNSFYSYKFAGLDPADGRPMFYGAEEYYTFNGNYVLDGTGNRILNADRYAAMDRQDVFLKEIMAYSGRRVPVLQGGIVNTFSWKRMILSFNLAYSLGSKVRLLNLFNDVSQTNATIAPQPVENVRRELLGRWKTPGDEVYTNIPGILSPSEFMRTTNPWWDGKPYAFAENIWDMYNYADIRVVSGNYMKLQSLSFRWTLPSKICQKLYMKSAYIGVAATNLFTICSKELKGQSPTQNGGSGKEINMSERPTFSFNFNVTF